MSEKKRIESVVTREDLDKALLKLGVKKGMVLETHSSLSAFGYIVGGAQTLVDAYLEAIGYDGTLVMSMQASENTDPTGWVNPPINHDLYQVIRDSTPAFDRRNTDTSWMGRTVDNFRRREGVVASLSPSCAYCAWGKYARLICGRQPLHFPLGEDSPTSHLYDLDGWCLLAGVDYDTATCMHLSEYRSKFREIVISAGAVEMGGRRVWKKYLDRNLDSDIFVSMGKLMEEKKLVRTTEVNGAVLKLFRIREAVDLAVAVFEKRMKV